MYSSFSLKFATCHLFRKDVYLCFISIWFVHTIMRLFIYLIDLWSNVDSRKDNFLENHPSERWLEETYKLVSLSLNV